MKNYGLKDPERPLGTVKWPEFTSSVGKDQAKSMLTRSYTALYHLNRRHGLKHEAYKQHQEWDPLGLEAAGPAKPKATELSFLNNAEWYNPTDELEIDLDNLYILARTGTLDQAQGLGQKTLEFVTGLINEQINAQSQTTI